MKFTIGWLAEHLQTDASTEQIAGAMVNCGLEVESIDNPAESLNGITAGEVLHAEKHAGSDRLKVCRVATCNGEKQVVCGAPNARKGIRVAYAPPGTSIPATGITLKKAVIRGVESAGMLCSAFELKTGDDHDGIIELPPDIPVGTPVAEVFGMTDPVIDFEVTPNRPDTNGVAGVARDLAAAGTGTLITKTPPAIAGRFPNPQEIDLRFDEETRDMCPAFAGRYIRGVNNGPSPAWLQNRLRATGLRPVNALVDITNFLALDRARPAHAYDADTLAGTLHARPGRKGESFRALDGKTYAVDRTMCVIADDTGVLGLGGIMGGETTGCTPDTKNVFIEAACFSPARIAAAGRKTGIVSDARYRFERGTDPAFILPGLEMATAMVLDLCGGTPGDTALCGRIPETERKIPFPPGELERLTGMSLPQEESARILTALGFDVHRRENEGEDLWHVGIPSWRPDIGGKADLVEEITRIAGFDRLPAQSLPPVDPVRTEPARQARTRMRHTLAARGMHQAITWSFTDIRHAALFCEGKSWLESRGLVLANPVSADLSAMRPSVLPGLLAALQRNVDRGNTNVALFEEGPVYYGDSPDDQKDCAAGVRRRHERRHWNLEIPQADVYTVKADALAALAAAGFPATGLHTADSAPAHYHPGRSGTLVLGKNSLAFFGEIHPQVMKTMDVTGPVYAFEVFPASFPVRRKKAGTTKPPLKIPDLLPLTRDFSFIVDADLPAQTLLEAVRRADRKLITGVLLFDVYEGKGIREGKKSLGVEISIQPDTKTLTDRDIETLCANVVTRARKEAGAVLRQET